MGLRNCFMEWGRPQVMIRLYRDRMIAFCSLMMISILPSGKTSFSRSASSFPLYPPPNTLPDKASEVITGVFFLFPLNSKEAILKEMGGFIADVMGDDWIGDEKVEMETSFNDDIEIESIEIVALAEKVRDRWGDKVDFVGWLSAKELEEIMNLTVGDVVEHIHSCLS